MRHLLLFIFFGSCFGLSYSQTWVQKANFGGNNTYQAVGFSIGKKGYMGTGLGFTYKNDFWEYDPATNAWTQKANFGGTPRRGATGFSIGTKGYLGTGRDAAGFLNDFWEYDPALNTWTQKSNFPGVARTGAVGFSIGNYGYIGTGTTASTVAYNDFWQYDPLTDSWAQKANAGWPARFYAVGFGIGSKGYLGTGRDPVSNAYLQDFWEYDPATNLWAQKASLPGVARMEAVGFSMPVKSKGYIGTGYSFTYLNDFWEYDAASNSWSQKQNLPAPLRDFAAGFTIDSCAYIGTGYTGIVSIRDFWEYGNECAVCIPPNGYVSPDITICAGNSGSLSAFASSGNPPYTYTWIPSTDLSCSTCSATIASPSATTTYSVIITDDGACPDTNLVTVTVNPSPLVSAGPDVTVHHVQNTTLTGSSATGYNWSTGAATPSIIVRPSATTSYILTTTNAYGCTSDDTVTVFVFHFKGPIYLPNAFSPNMDGENDFLQLYFDPWMVKEAHITIYNRWGEVVFRSADKNFRWDGNFEGKELNTSVFAYELHVVLTEGPEVFEKGNVSLVR